MCSNRKFSYINYVFQYLIELHLQFYCNLGKNSISYRIFSSFGPLIRGDTYSKTTDSGFKVIKETRSAAQWSMVFGGRRDGFPEVSGTPRKIWTFEFATETQQ